MFSRSSHPMDLIEGCIRPNRKWEIQYGGLQTGSIYILTCRHDRSEISTVISIFARFSYPMRMIEMLCNQAGSGKFKTVASQLKIHVGYLHLKIRNQRNSNGCFGVQLSNGSSENTVWPNRNCKIKYGDRRTPNGKNTYVSLKTW